MDKVPGADRLKILFLIRSMHVGGAERQLAVLARGLKAKGYEVAVAVCYAGGPLEKELEEGGIRLFDLGKRGRWDLVHFLSAALTVVRKENPDVLYGFLVTENLLASVLKCVSPGSKVVWSIQAAYMDLTRYDWLTSFSYKVESLLSGLPDLVVANSDSGRGYALQRGFRPKHLVVINNGIDTERFRPSMDERHMVRSEWGMPEHLKVIGLAGRLDPMKDHVTFLKACRMLLQGRKDIRFVCVGNGPAQYRDSLRALQEELDLGGAVTWIGAREDMPAVYNAFDILTSSSYGEGFSNVIAEGMACSVPCVATDVGDSSRIIGDTGIIVPPSNPDALARGWQQMLDLMERESSLGNHARARIIRYFSVDTLVQKTAAELKRLG